jgi:hypothetical protein
MKINLMYGRGQNLPKHININAIPTDEEEIIVADPSDLDFFVDDAEAEVIIAHDVINFLPRERMIPTIKHWTKKLRHGGSITIGGVDCYAISRDIVANKISLQDLNIILYGSEIPSWDVRRNVFTMQSLVDHLKELGLKIVKSRIDKYEIVVEAIRP